MISQAGAALIATVYPIGLLIVTVNRRDLDPAPITGQVKRRIRAVVETVRGFAIIGAVVSVMGCVAAVAMDVPIRNPLYIAGVSVSGLIVGLTAMFVLQDLGFAAAKKFMNPPPRAAAHDLRHTPVRLALRRAGRLSVRATPRRTRGVVPRK